MDVFQEVSALVADSRAGDVNVVGPTTTIRSATTSVVVRNGHTVVIGGLISDEKNARRSGVPFLSDIPFIGNFFSSKGDTQAKINLLIFLTPHIVRNPAELREQSVQSRNKLQAFMQQHRFSDQRPEFLNAQTWNPDLSEYEGRGERKSGVLLERPTGRLAPAPEEMPPASGSLRPDVNDQSSPPAAPVAPLGDDMSRIEVYTDVRFVLLAEFAQNGNPPDGLRTNSGLLAVELDKNSQLTSLFRRGNQYRFASDTFQGLYHCLDTYPTAQEALLVYPEGMPVDPEKGEFLHWRELSDASSANSAAWTTLE
jgi:hypothetical protein